MKATAMAHEVADSPPALAITNLSKSFGNHQVLSGVGLEIQRQSIHALLGANGSGKSTLVKCIAGVHRADHGGRIRVGAYEVEAHNASPGWAREAGLRFVHQNPGFFPTMTVAENLVMSSADASVRLFRHANVNRHARRLLDEFGIEVLPTAQMGALRLADQTMVAIARTLGVVRNGSIDTNGGSILVLDEPTAALPDEDVEILFRFLRRAVRSDVSVVYISHRLEEVRALCDQVTVLRDGHVVRSGPLAGLTERELVTSIVGRTLDRLFPEAAVQPGHEVVARAVSVTGAPLRGVSFDVRQGEIVGIAGLAGAGQSEVLRSFFGSHKLLSGSLELDGTTISPRTPREAMELGIAYVPKHRDVDAIFPDLSVRTNFSAGSLLAYSRLGVIGTAREREASLRAVRHFGVKTAGDQAPMSSLSGGNQQKVVLSRWIARTPRLLLLDEPTQGVDVGARADVYRLIRQAAADGMGVVMVSSDFDELAEMSDRVVMLHAGRSTRLLEKNEVSRHRLTELAFSAGEVEQ